jgi:pimeloyl-ACP methyl ester carboxylesterase
MCRVDSVVEQRGVRLHYEMLGRGDPVVLCHGLGGDREAMKALAGPLPGCRLIVWDCRGHGRSNPTGPAEYYSFSSFAEDLGVLLEHLGIARAVIGGVSMGAAVAARFAVHRPEQVRGLVLVRPAWVDQGLSENLRFFPIIADLLSREGASRGLEEFRRLREVRDIESACPYTYESLCSHFNAPRAVERSVRLDRLPRDAPIRTWKEVEALRMPALVVGTEHDLIHPMAFALQWAERLQDGKLVLIEPKSRNEIEHTRAFRARLAAFINGLER